MGRAGVRGLAVVFLVDAWAPAAFQGSGGRAGGGPVNPEKLRNRLGEASGVVLAVDRGGGEPAALCARSGGPDLQQDRLSRR